MKCSEAAQQAQSAIPVLRSNTTTKTTSNAQLRATGIVYSILNSSNRIPIMGQQQKMYSCILPVDSYHGTTIVTSDCAIATSGHHGSIRTTFISNNSVTQYFLCFLNIFRSYSEMEHTC